MSFDMSCTFLNRRRENVTPMLAFSQSVWTCSTCWRSCIKPASVDSWAVLIGCSIACSMVNGTKVII